MTDLIQDALATASHDRIPLCQVLFPRFVNRHTYLPIHRPLVSPSTGAAAFRPKSRTMTFELDRLL